MARESARFRLRDILLCLGITLGATAGAQTPPSPDIHAQPPRAWADAAAANQLHILENDTGSPLRYRVHRTDSKGESLREVIESHDGNISRTLERNGHPLTAVEDSAERDRLNDILQSPDAFLKRHRGEGAGRTYVKQLVSQLPAAMLWTYAPNQPQNAHAAGRQIVLDFTPDPHYKPPTLITEGLTGLAGRVWIDAQTHVIARVEGRILHTVDVGWGGLLARVNQGGTVELEQTPVSNQRWLYTHLAENLMLRELLVRNVTEITSVDASDWHLLPAPVSLQQAIHELLAMPVPTR